MAQIHNSELSKELIKGGALQASRDAIPNQLAEKVVPVMEVNPRLLKNCNVSRRGFLSNATSATLFTTPTDKDFYVCAAQMGYIKDATSTATTLRMTCITEENLSGALIVIPTLTLTAGNGGASVSIVPPLKLTRGSIIACTSDSAVANIKVDGCIQGYTVDNINA
jgi:hypothetical protein